jgi:signal transduction histidine kinase
MKKPDDLAHAIDVMQQELRGLGLRFAVCGIAIIDEREGKLDVYSALEDGGLETRELAVGNVPEVQQLIDGWRERRVSTLRFDDEKLPPRGARPEWRWVVAVPFSHGVVFLGGAESEEPREDDVATLTEFADAITIAYQRFADFRELQEAQLQLIQSEKMASLGQLVAGVAHELNTPMGALQSNTQTERATLGRIRDLVERGDHDSLLKAIAALEDMNGVNEAAARRMSQIVANLRRFARLDESEWKSADVREGLDETLALVEHETKDRIEIEKAYDDVPPVHCYPGQLNQVFMNLVVNAIQAIDGNGRIRVETHRDGDEVIIRIADTGSGIPKADIGRVFDPGFTTKGVGVGTGLGLSICYRIIENHGGRLEVSSEEGKGSVFTIAIPVNAERPDRTDRGARSRSAGARPVTATSTG